MMSYLISLIFIGMLFQPKFPAAKSQFTCEPDYPFEDICVIRNHDRLIAINDTDEDIKVQLFISDVENVDLTYKYPFIEFIPARSQKTILKYKVHSTDFWRLEYDWVWGK